MQNKKEQRERSHINKLEQVSCSTVQELRICLGMLFHNIYTCRVSNIRYPALFVVLGINQIMTLTETGGHGAQAKSCALPNKYWGSKPFRTLVHTHIRDQRRNLYLMRSSTCNQCSSVRRAVMWQIYF